MTAATPSAEHMERAKDIRQALMVRAFEDDATLQLPAGHLAIFATALAEAEARGNELYREALEAIADGEGDPQVIAQQTLAAAARGAG